MGTFEALMGSNGFVDDRIFSVTTGTVKENWNQDFPGMVKVELFMGEQGKNITGWIPVMAPYAGNGYGTYTLPEVGTEVVVAFNMGDRNCPIVIGSLWNAVNKLPEKTAADKNPVKLFKTMGGSSITVTDEKGKEKIEVATPGKLGIVLEDENKKITVHDADGKNTLTIDANSGTVEIAADKKFVLKAGNKEVLTVDGSAGSCEIKTNQIKLQASQGMQVKGQNDKYEGTMIKIAAQSQLEVSSSGITNVKGSMVKIN